MPGAPGAPQSAGAGPWGAGDFAPKPTAPMEGPAQDTIWSSLKTAGARVLDAAGYGFQQGWGSEPLGLSADTEKSLRDAGWFNDFQSGHIGFSKTVNEALLRPAAAVADVAQRVGTGTLLAVSGAGGAAASAIEGENPGIVRKTLAFPFGAAGEIAGASTEGFLPEFGMLPHGAGAIADSDMVRQTATARSVGVLGEGEAGAYDAAPLTPENTQARAAAAQEAGLEPEQSAPAPPAAAPEAAAPVIPTVDDVARRIDPETFGQYDSLTAERDSLRTELERHQEARSATPEAEAARTDIADLLGVEHDEPVEATIGRETAFRASASEAQITKLDDAFNRLETALSTDTPEQAALRDRLTGVNLALRDITPNMAQAVRNATDIMPDAGEATAKAEEAAKPEAGEPEQAREEGGKAEPTPAQEKVEQAAAAGASPEAQAEVAPGNVLGNETIGGQRIARGFEADTRDEPQPQNVEGETTTAESSVVQPEGEAAPGAERPKPRYTNALRPTEGTGELATRSLAKGVEARAVEEGLASRFGDLPEYHRLSMADQAAKALELIDKDYESAKSIALGDKQPPKGLLPETMYVAVEKHALAAGDVETLQQLATRSRLTTAATTMGQRIRTLGERDQASPVGAIQDVVAARVADASRRGDLAKATRETMDEARAEVRKAASSVDKWNDFLQSISCSE